MEEKPCNTSVTISKPALDRLSEIDRALGNKSRDRTGRDLILEYIERNRDLPANDRLTHISTVMRHPLPPPRWSDEGPVVPTRHLKLRLPDRRTSEKAQELAFRLPGQAQSRGHTHYRSRPLTDALMTSIAYKCRELGLDPITDPILAGVYPLIRQRAARGLWQLAVNATRTAPERVILRKAEASRENRDTHRAKTGEQLEPRHEEDVAALLEMVDLNDGEAVWHHDHRYHLVQYLAFHILSTTSKSDPARWEQALYDQAGEDWLTLVYDPVVRNPKPRAIKARVGRASPTSVGVSFEGRGGGAVWRAERIVALSKITDWLGQSASSGGTRSLRVDPPGWRLVLPDGWNPSFFTGSLPNDWAKHVAKRRVLHFDLDHPEGTPPRHMVWPTIDNDHGDPIPVAGLQTVLSALMDNTKDRRDVADPRKAATPRKAADPRKAAEILLLELMPSSPEADRGWHDRTVSTSDDVDDADSPFINSITADDNSLLPSPFDQSAGLPAADSSAVAGRPATPAPRYPGDVPPLPDLSRKTEPAETVEDTTDPRIEEDRWYADWLSRDGGASDVVLPVYVPAETARRLGFIDEAHAQRLIDDAKARNETAIEKALNVALLEHGQDDHDALDRVRNDPTQFAALAHKLRIEFVEVTAAWCWYVTTLSEEAETHPERLRWLAAHLTEVYTRVLDREMHAAVRRAAARFAYLHRG
ncbi:hypothetical protein [Prescottella equi]